MTRLILSLCLVVAARAAAQPALTNIVLNPGEIVVVPVTTDRFSMICFPSPISHLEGAYLSTETEPPARFQVNFKPGSSYFSVRALAENVSAAVAVVWKEKTFVFELTSSSHPLLTVRLVEPAARDSVSTSRLPSSHRLLGILDTAKAYSVLRAQHPAEVADVVYLPKHDRYDFGSCELLVEELFHFKTEDTLVFRLVFHNKTSRIINYRPQSFRVRVGQKTFYAAISDGDGVLPPMSSTPVYFAIDSAPDGSRPGLSPQNDYSILFTFTLPEPGLGPAPQQP
jgi:hypothetical protein